MEARSRRIDVEIPEGDWTSTDDGSVLFATIWVCGCPMHLEAHAIRNASGVEGRTFQESDGDLSSFNELHAAFECQGPLEEVTIRGRQYVLFAHAYGR